jgi:hypothetical protein
LNPIQADALLDAFVSLRHVQQGAGFRASPADLPAATGAAHPNSGQQAQCTWPPRARALSPHQLTLRRAAEVRNSRLARAAARLGLHAHVRCRGRELRRHVSKFALRQQAAAAAGGAEQGGSCGGPPASTAAAGTATGGGCAQFEDVVADAEEGNDGAAAGGGWAAGGALGAGRPWGEESQRAWEEVWGGGGRGGGDRGGDGSSGGSGSGLGMDLSVGGAVSPDSREEGPGSDDGGGAAQAGARAAGAGAPEEEGRNARACGGAVTRQPARQPAPKALADVVEALIGAVWLDSGGDWGAAWRVAAKVLEATGEEGEENEGACVE